MSNIKTKSLFTFIQRIFFVEIGNKLRPGSLKNFVDLLFIISEKLGHNFEIISKNYIEIYTNVVEEEIKLAKISSKDRVLVIGAGSIPSTSVILAKETNAQIIAIDIDLKAALKASLYVKKHNLQNKIEIKSSNGINYQVKDFDVIFVLYGVKQKPGLLKYLSENINENTWVIYRAVNDMQSKTKNEETELSKLFNIENIANTKSFGSMNSFLLSKKTKD